LSQRRNAERSKKNNPSDGRISLARQCQRIAECPKANDDIFKDYGPTYQYRIPGLDEDFSLPADNLSNINTPESLSMKKFVVDLMAV